MKKFSKILSVALLVALVLSLGVANAFAADPDYTITVTNTLKDETYSAYKMFDLVVDDPTDPSAYTYTVNSAWTGFTSSDAFKAAFTIENSYVKAKSGVESETDWVAGSVMSTLAEAAGKYAADNNIQAVATEVSTADNANVVLNVGGPGYFVITSTVGSRAMIQTTPADSKVTVIEKNDEDNIEKEVKEDSTGEYGETNDAQVGDTVEFKSEATIAARSINVKIHDTMDSGLTLNADSITIYTDAALENEYTGATIRTASTNPAADTNDTFTIDIPDSFAATATASLKLYVVYTAEINANAVVKDDNGVAIVDQNNKTKVSFGDHGSSSEDHTTTTTHKFMVYKHKGQETANLADAVFQVLKGTEVVKLIKIDATNYRVADDTEAAGTPASHADDGELNTVEVGALVNDFVTVASGDITIWGVDSDTDYKLHEVQPPKGYNALAADKEVTVNAANNTRVDVENNTGAQLPSTGGIGTTIFYVVGGVLVLAAIILLVTKKRMSE